MRNFIALEVRGAETQRARDLLGSLAVTSSGRTEFQVLGFSGWKTLIRALQMVQARARLQSLLPPPEPRLSSCTTYPYVPRSNPSRRGFVSSHRVKIKDFETEAEKPEPWVDGIS